MAFDHIPDDRAQCTACIMSCYRDTSTLMHAGVAARAMMTPSVAQSLGTTLAEIGLLTTLGR